MNIFTIYPRGYTTGKADAPQRQVSAGDLVVDSLYEYLVSSKGRVKNWKFYSQVLDVALIHFGDFHEWLDTQLSNPALTGSYRDYLIDTLAFIAGGTRSVNYSSWMFMLEPLDLRADQVNIQRLFQSSQYLPKELTTIQILQRWCARPNGIEDLLTTMYVLFGHPSRTLE